MKTWQSLRLNNKPQGLVPLPRERSSEKFEAVRHYIKLGVIKILLLCIFPEEEDAGQDVFRFSMFNVVLQLRKRRRCSLRSLFFHALLVMPECPGECECVSGWFLNPASFLVTLLDRLNHVIALFISCSPHLSLSFVPCCSSLVRPAETANRAPALYRQSNQRPTSLKPTSTSCRLS